MNEYDIDSALDGQVLNNFEETLQQEIFLTSFTAITAKKILLVAKVKGVDAAALYDGVGAWLEKLSEGNTNAQKS